jgi:hypothetical protein
MRSFGKQSVVTAGELLAVAAGFAVYFLGIGVIVTWIAYLILTWVHHGSGGALLFTVRTLLPLSVIVGLLVLFHRAIKRSLSKRGGTGAKNNDSIAN